MPDPFFSRMAQTNSTYSISHFVRMTPVIAMWLAKSMPLAGTGVSCVATWSGAHLGMRILGLRNVDCNSTNRTFYSTCLVIAQSEVCVQLASNFVIGSLILRKPLQTEIAD